MPEATILPDEVNTPAIMNFTPYGISVLLSSFILLISSCNRFIEDPEDPVLASVGNEQLTLNEAFNSIPEVVLRQDTLLAIRNYQSDWIEERVLENEANRIGLATDPDIIRRVENLKTQLVLNALKEGIIANNREELEVTREEAQNYYQANRERFILDERYVRFRHMTTTSRVDADNARRAIMNGDPWPDITERYSINPERQLSDSERFIPVSMATPDIPTIRRYLDVIGITEISQVVSHGGYFHFVQLMEERPAGDNPDLDWLVEQIKKWLYIEKSQRFINSYKRNLYLQADANNEIEMMDVSNFDESSILNALQTE